MTFSIVFGGSRNTPTLVGVISPLFQGRFRPDSIAV
jgi:hypothetical protein